MIDLTLEQLKALFKKGEGPRVIKFTRLPNSILIELHVPTNLSWFKGHFPEQAVLPGVVQIDWAAKLSIALLDNIGVFRQLNNIKFKTMVLPDTSMSVELIYKEDRGNLQFHFFNETESFSTGSFKFLIS